MPTQATNKKKKVATGTAVTAVGVGLVAFGVAIYKKKSRSSRSSVLPEHKAMPAIQADPNAMANTGSEKATSECREETTAPLDAHAERVIPDRTSERVSSRVDSADTTGLWRDEANQCWRSEQTGFVQIPNGLPRGHPDRTYYMQEAYAAAMKDYGINPYA